MLIYMDSAADPRRKQKGFSFMNHLTIPAGYRTRLSVYDTQRAIELIKQVFQKHLCAALNLKRVSAPLFVPANTGLNDDLNGTERPVSFDVPAVGGEEFQVVHSLAKWKRLALKNYDFYVGKGLYTDMNAIRRDEEVLDNLHSVYVDQWDWEKVISREDRTLDYLKDTVRRIVSAICNNSAGPSPTFTRTSAAKSPSSLRRNSRTATPTSRRPNARRNSPACIRPSSSCRSARRCAPAKSTMAAHPTMTTGT